MEIGRDDQPATPNMWPSGDKEAEEFKAEMLAFFETCKNLYAEVMRAIALGMGIEESFFDGFTDGGDNTLRLLHYPGVSKSVFKRDDGQVQVRAGEHSDYGMIMFRTPCKSHTKAPRRNYASLSRHPRRSASQISKRNLCQCYTHRRHHCS